MSDYTQTRHPRREAGIQCQGQFIHGVWIPAIPAGMTILNGAFIEYDKVELSPHKWFGGAPRKSYATHQSYKKIQLGIAGSKKLAIGIKSNKPP